MKAELVSLFDWIPCLNRDLSTVSKNRYQIRASPEIATSDAQLQIRRTADPLARIQIRIANINAEHS